jgi:hypothetical protein
MAQNATFSYQDKFSEAFETVLEQHALEEDAEIEHLWNDYLKNTTQFDNNEFQKACKQLETRYQQSLFEIEVCYEKASEQEKQYSSQWVDDLTEQFGKAYVLKNMELIRFHVAYMYIRNGQNSCEEFKKEAIYREYPYKAASNEFISNYLDFLDSLDEEIRIKLSERKEALEELKGLLNKVSIQELLSVSSTEVRVSLFAEAVKERPESDAKLTDFFLQHPFFSKPFNGGSCLKDLKKLGSR